MAKWLVIQLGIEDVVIALIYMAQGDFPRAAYWLAAGVLTGSTLLIK